MVTLTVPFDQHRHEGRRPGTYVARNRLFREPRITPPGEQLAGRQPVTPRDFGHRPHARVALRYNRRLVGLRPPTPLPSPCENLAPTRHRLRASIVTCIDHSTKLLIIAPSASRLTGIGRLPLNPTRAMWDGNSAYEPAALALFGLGAFTRPCSSPGINQLEVQARAEGLARGRPHGVPHLRAKCDCRRRPTRRHARGARAR